MRLQIGRPVVLNQWINWSRVHTKATRVQGRESHYWDSIPPWLDRYARGRSFVDIGTMWGEQWGAFDAAEHGASPVTALDVTPPTAACLVEQQRRGNPDVRFVTGDLHDPATLRELGTHDVVLCSGILYHSPNPLLTLECLRSITREHLILGTRTIQEVPGLPHTCVFYPNLHEPERLAFAAPIDGTADGLTTPFDPALGYSNYWWGISRSALHSMLGAVGWEVVEQVDRPAAPGYHTWVVARPAADWSPSQN